MSELEKTYSKAELNGAVHTAVQLAMTGKGNANDSLTQGIRYKMAQAISGGYDFSDTLHNIYLDYGYPASLSFFNFWNMYRRFGVAKRVVELAPDQTWMDDPIVESDDRTFMRDLRTLIGTDEDGVLTKNSVGLWRRVKGLDTRQRVGRYAGMFMRVRDGKTPDQKLEGTLNGLSALVDMVPLYEGQLTVQSTNDNAMDDDFGQPSMYQFVSSGAGNRNEKQGASFNIHPSRIVIAAEGSDNGGIYGIPALESIYNDLMDLRKTLGGGAEGFYKNAAQSIVFDLKDAASAASNQELLNQFNENFDEFSHNRARRSMWTPGMEANTLESNLISSDPFVQGSLLAISSGSGIPVALLTGNQTGRLAGDQDSKAYLGNIQARRTDFGSDLVTSVIDWLMKYAILPTVPYAVEWPDAQAPSQEQKLGNADKMAETNQRSFDGGGGQIYSEEEIREAGGFDAEELPEEVDTDDADERNIDITDEE